ncbi:MAG: sigma-70 family RNA polymerase sigma factor, partial [Phycisphaerales bacterium]|nr:sigma-70 family RNA polymerase sigma factor [Phycisphaerales bacterium]
MNERTMIGQEKEGDVIRHADQSSDPALRGGGGACPQEREALLGRFADLVYASALRQMNGDTHAAADVTQAVFIVAMEKRRAGKLPEDERLAGWLLKVTAFCVKKARWAAMQRRFHERRAMRSEVMQQELSTDAVAKALDGALLKLGAIDREVVVRRYLHGETVGSVAAAVRMTENAASQRIGRALEKLRKILARRGVVVPAVALTGVMIAESAKAAPAALAVA